LWCADIASLQDDLCSFFNALMTCSGAQQDSGTSVVACSITRDKGPPYAFIKLRSVQETSNALAFNGIQFRGSTLKVATLAAQGQPATLVFKQSAVKQPIKAIAAHIALFAAAVGGHRQGAAVDA
jgi:hypothetical protein